MTIPERMPNEIAGLVAMIALVALAFLLVIVFGPRSAASAPADDVKVWTMPSCPRELTLQDGSRWAKPDWSDPKCRASIGWQVVKP